MNEIKFKRLSENATIPTRAHKTDSGFDLYAAEETIIAPGQTKVIPTDVSVQLPENMEAQVRPKSGITSKTGLRVQLGTIDNGFRGGIGVIMDNISTHTDAMVGKYALGVDGGLHEMHPYDRYIENVYCVFKGDKIAQLVLQHLPQVEPVEVTEFTDTERGGNGFGSTGV